MYYYVPISVLERLSQSWFQCGPSKKRLVTSLDYEKEYQGVLASFSLQAERMIDG